MRIILDIFLFPFSFLWSSLYAFRRYLYMAGVLKSDYFLLPVVSVGNIVMGGSGKTPFVGWLTEVFQDSSLDVCILSRGYRSELEKSFGVIQKDSPNKNPELFGDEPVLLSSRLKGNSLVVVGKNRNTNLKKVFKKFKPQVVLLDDGFQHLKIRRDINIVLFDATIPLHKLRTPPLGYLRESLESLRDADIVVLNKVGALTEEKIKEIEETISQYTNKGTDIYKTTYKVDGVFNINGEKIEESSELKGRDVLSFSGIANPDNFNHSLLTLGANIEHAFNFSDHYSYKDEDIDKILEVAKEKNLDILTTEKDIVKLQGMKGTENIKYLRISIDFLEGKERFLNQINDKIVLDYFNTKTEKINIHHE